MHNNVRKLQVFVRQLRSSASDADVIMNDNWDHNLGRSPSSTTKNSLFQNSNGYGLGGQQRLGLLPGGNNAHIVVLVSSG